VLAVALVALSERLYPGLLLQSQAVVVWGVKLLLVDQDLCHDKLLGKILEYFGKIFQIH
jgi:hypothetical protein